MSKQVKVDEQDYERLVCNTNTLIAMGYSGGDICPNCKKYTLVNGYVCFGCGYDQHRED